MGTLFKIPGILLFIVSGVWGFFISMGIVVDNLGFLGGAIAFMIFPATMAFAPLYEGLANSNWFPVLLVYGGMVGAMVLNGIGEAIDGR